MSRLYAVLALAGAACASQDIVAASALPGDAPPYCRGKSPAIVAAVHNGSVDSVCVGSVAVQTFERALCTCEGYVTSTTLTTDSFDSARGPYVPGGTTGDVGINGELRTNAVVEVGGGLAVSGAAGALLVADLHAARDLEIAGALGNAVTVTVGGNARLAGNTDLAALTVAGTLTAPPAAQLNGTITAGAVVRAPVTVEPPCACNDLLDLAPFISGHVTDNQDALIGLTPDQLTDYRGDVTVNLPCGIYYFGPVRGEGALTLRVTGRAVLLIDGDLSLTAPLTVELATDDAELDLMIGGLLSSNQPIRMGRPDHPARTRVYVGGSGTIDLSGDSSLAANFYAPRAAVALSGGATVYGSLFVRRLDQSAPVSIHYDVDVRRADVACPL